MKGEILFYASYLLGSICVFLIYHYKFFTKKLVMTAIYSFEYPLYSISVYGAAILTVSAAYFLWKEKLLKKKKNKIAVIGQSFMMMGIFTGFFTRFSSTGVDVAKIFVLVGIISFLFILFTLCKKKETV